MKKIEELKYERELTPEEKKEIIVSFLMGVSALLFAYHLIKKNEKN